ncbi:MAG: hypothetical protein JXD23_02395 [Spirochaetales bacterium]|nr:hypothetical protein [Spirochaetales bacterium]
MDSVYMDVVPLRETQYLSKYSFWKRLEPRAREDNFMRSLQACVRDPLWMLTRQWQLGEMKAEDAGSPVNVTYQTERSTLTHCKARAFGAPGAVKRIPGGKPLETMLEQEIPVIDFRLSVQLGLELEQELRASGVREAVIDKFKELFAVDDPPEEEKAALDEETLDFLRVAANRVINGKKLMEAGDLVCDSPTVPGEIAALADGGERESVVVALEGLYSWYRSVYAAPILDSEVSWDHSGFNYAACCAAPRNGDEQYVFEISESPGGELDWPHFTVIRDPSKKLEHSDDVGDALIADDPVEMIPTPIQFDGMPNSRFWAFEDAKINFGTMDVKTTDIAKLLLMEFAFVYGDDWFHIPLPLAVGSVCRLKTLTVNDVFGNEHAIMPAGGASGQGWQRWDMFGISYKREKQLEDAERNRRHDSAPILFFPPTLGRNETSPDFEEARFLRDETANMVWAVQHMIANGLGSGISGFDYWKSRNDKQDIMYARTVLPRLFSLFQATAPARVAAVTDTALSMEGVAEMLAEIPAMGLLVDTVRELGDMISNAAGYDSPSCTLLHVKSGAAARTADALRETAEALEDIGKKTALKRFLQALDSTVQALALIAFSFKRARLANSTDAFATYMKDIKESMAALVDITALGEDDGKLLETGGAPGGGVPLYRLMSSVPENWIPYVPVQTKSGGRDIQLVQARLMRERNGDTDFIPVVSRILTTAESGGEMHVVNEEAVARHGLNVRMHWQRARWIDGSTHVWTARRVGPGRGESSSGLRFDYLEE